MELENQNGFGEIKGFSTRGIYRGSLIDKNVLRQKLHEFALIAEKQEDEE